MRTADYDYELPKELIASYPLEKRDESRLLHYNPKTGSVKHLKFKNIVEILEKGDLLVRNNSKVMPARLFVENTPKVKKQEQEQEKEKGNDSNPHSADDGEIKKIEILLIKPADASGYVWEIMAKPLKKLKVGESYKVAEDIFLKVEEKNNEKVVSFGSVENLKAAVNAAGSMPIPPYMSREAGDFDKDRYQTIYATESNLGASVAAPTAGLHFTEEVFSDLKEKGVELAELTLHVGPGTFLPIKSDNVLEHKMHHETFSVDKENLEKIRKAKSEGRRIVAVGSTATRCLESIAKEISKKDLEIEDSLVGETDIFIYPGYEFQVVNGMLTNFHLPKSTLILMVSAFIGDKETRKIYAEAIKEKYRFYSYGDCMFVY